MFRHTQSADIQQNHNMGKSNQITRKIDPVEGSSKRAQ